MLTYKKGAQLNRMRERFRKEEEQIDDAGIQNERYRQISFVCGKRSKIVEQSAHRGKRSRLDASDVLSQTTRLNLNN